MPLSDDEMNQAPQGLRIGGAARVTGLATSTIRAWERRYGAIEPKRTSAGYRLYDPETVERLQLIQVLRDRGEPLASLAACETHELRARAATHHGGDGVQSGRGGTGRLKVALVHPTLPTILGEYAAGTLPFEIAWTSPDIATLDIDAAEPVDLLVVQLDGLGDKPMEALRSLASERATGGVIVETGFTRRATLQSLKHAGYRTTQGPLTMADLTTIVAETRTSLSQVTAPAPASEPVPPPRFSPQELSTLREMSTSIDCECPRHLAALVMQLTAFEQYSENCEDDAPEEAALHAYLARETGRARALVETMLAKVCEAEGALLG